MSDTQSVDWVPEDSADAYKKLSSELYGEGALIDQVVSLYRDSGSEIREEFKDRIGKLGTLATALKDLGEESSDTSSYITDTTASMASIRKEHNGTRSGKQKFNRIREAEDLHTEYEVRMDTFFKGAIPSWILPDEDVAAQMKRVCRSSGESGGSMIILKQHVNATAKEELARVVSTAIGNGDAHVVVSPVSGVSEGSPLDGVAVRTAHAHRVLAALVEQFKKAKWHTPIAVAVLERNDGPEPVLQAVYATVDGAAVFPKEVLLPSDTIPVHFLTKGFLRDALPLYGEVYPVRKLLALVKDPWVIRGVATTDTSDPNLDMKNVIQDSTLHKAIVGSGEAPPCTVSRDDLATVKSFQSTSLINKFRQSLGGEVPLSVDQSRDTVYAARWLGADQPFTYISTYMKYALADAYAELHVGNPQGSTYPLTELERMTS